MDEFVSPQFRLYDAKQELLEKTQFAVPRETCENVVGVSGAGNLHATATGHEAETCGFKDNRLMIHVNRGEVIEEKKGDPYRRTVASPVNSLKAEGLVNLAWIEGNGLMIALQTGAHASRLL